MKTKRDQQGFSVIELLIVLVIIGLIGGLGWYVWQQRSQKSEPATQSTSSIGQNPQIDSQASSPAYFTLTDFKVRIPLNDKTSGLQPGSVNASIYSEADKSIPILAPEFDDGWKCLSDTGNGTVASIGSISVSTQAKRAGPGEPAASKTIGTYTFGFEPAGANCTDNPQYQQVVDAFKTQFDQIQAY